MRHMAIVALTLVAASPSFAQSPEWAAKVDEAAKPWAREKGPGGVVGVAVDGKVVYAKGFGLANLEHGVPLTPDSVLDVGSVSKQFTAMCVLLLEEDGKLKTTDPVTKFVPELPTFGHTVTIDHLVHMTSGVRDYLTLWSLAGWNGVDERSDEDALASLSRQQGLNNAPGERFVYSNSNYVLLATIVERVSGSSLASFASERVFKPLGMDSTRFDTDSIVVKSRAQSYAPNGFGGWKPLVSALSIVGDGGVLSTVGDLAKWHANLRDNKLGKGSPALAQKFTEGVTVGAGSPNYAFGLIVDELDGIQRIGHNGNWLGFNASTMFFPDRKVSIFALGNDGTNSCAQIAAAAARAVLGRVEASAETPPKEAQLGRPALERVAGTYELPDGRTLTIRLVGDGLQLQVAGQPAFPLLAESATKFYVKAPTVRIDFTFEGPGKPVSGRLRQGPADIQLKPVEPFEAADAELKAWAGVYSSPELEVPIEVQVQGKSLVFTAGEGDPLVVRPSSADKVSSPIGTATLFRDTAGKVRGFVLDAGRALGLRFTKAG
ncbi:MAG: serine hydrolase [Fimbriimonadaceae bacterium]